MTQSDVEKLMINGQIIRANSAAMTTEGNCDENS
jgi:hypothetical protein